MTLNPGVPAAVAILCLFGPLVSAQNQDQAPAREIRLSIDEAVAMLVRNNLGLRVAILDEEIDRAKIREVLGAFDPVFFGTIAGGRSEVLFPANFPLDPSNPLSPTVTRVISQTSQVARSDLGVRGVLETGMSYELTFGTDYADRAKTTSLNPIFNNSTALTITQPLLRGAFSAYGEAPAELARLSAMSARETYRGTLRDKVREVQGHYYDLVFTIADLEVKRESERLAEDQVNLTRVRVDSGALPKIEMTAAESGKAGRHVDVITAEARVVEAEDRLRRMILAFDSPEDWEMRLLPKETPAHIEVQLKPVEAILALSERSEPSLLRAHLAVAQTVIVLGQRESERLPKLDLNATGRVTGLQGDLFQAHADAYSEKKGAASYEVGIGFEVPIGNRAAGARVAQSDLAVKKAKIELQDTRTEMIFRIRSSLRNIDVARRSIAARKEATRLAAEQLDNERLRLDVQKSTNFQVFQVEDQLNLRRTEETRALIDYRLALLDLSRVTSLPLSQLTLP